LLLLLFVTAFTAILLGIGLPSPAAYIICATILSPALVKMGVPLLQAHLFPLYYALFSHLTPPVGIGLMVACKMANSNYMQSAVEAMKAAMPSFFLPFFFIYAPGLLLQKETTANLLTIIACTFFFLALAIVSNRFAKTQCKLSDILLFLLSLFVFGTYVTVCNNILLFSVGLLLFIFGVGINSIRAKRTQTPRSL
ncbi:MAG: TRAP transporter large permease subunit, partial [Desulfovibrio sp.]|nr:TRAP transporter large permease subunit [Desulfovibrio sp.]